MMFFSLILAIVTLASWCSGQTADPAANGKTREVLKLIADMPNRGRVLSGQFAGYSPDTFNMKQMQEIERQTNGQVPAILGCDYACGWNTRDQPENIIDWSCNPSLKEHWGKGGLVTINLHIMNPVSWNGGAYKDRLNLNFDDLTKPDTETGRRWRSFLDRIASGLNDLQQAGVTVLFRPFHEMNGDWFWWCNQDAGSFKNAWIDMFNYLTKDKNLHNLLWVFSPDQSRQNPSRYYPGDAFVDIVGLDVYTDEPNNMNSYSEMTQINKPFALAEVGPSSTGGSFDYMKWLQAFENKFHRVSYFLAWNDNWSPLTNQNVYAFFNNYRLINRDQTGLNNNGGGGDISGQETVIYNFNNGEESWSGANIAGGPWATDEFTVQGTKGLKADVRLSENGQYYLLVQQRTNLAGKRTLKAHARYAPWGSPGNGMSAKLYIKAGDDWRWSDGGTQIINNYGDTTLTLDLSNVQGEINEIGVQFVSGFGSYGDSAIYISRISAE